MLQFSPCSNKTTRTKWIRMLFKWSGEYSPHKSEKVICQRGSSYHPHPTHFKRSTLCWCQKSKQWKWPCWVIPSYQAGDHTLPLFAQNLDHLENIHQLLSLSTVQKVPQRTENPRTGRTITEEMKRKNTQTRQDKDPEHILISHFHLVSSEPQRA